MTYVFDFDGVLFDTARECFEVAYATAKRLAPHRWSEQPSSELEASFLTHRHYVGPPWQYAVLLECLAEDRVPESTDAFLTVARRDESRWSGFTRAYFESRTELAKDLDRWCATIRPYPESLAAFRRLHDEGKASILSTRDPLSIHRIFAKFAGIEPDLLPRAGSEPKYRLLQEFAKQAHEPASRVWFLDDYAEHAIPAARHGFAAHLALWGYLEPADAHKARAAGVGCLELEELDESIARHAEETT